MKPVTEWPLVDGSILGAPMLCIVCHDHSCDMCDGPEADRLNATEAQP